MTPPPLPNFFIVGTGKAGTTSLYRYLRQHPRIYMSPVKEPAYFASEIRAANLSEPIRRHVALQSLQLRNVLDDGEAVKPPGSRPQRLAALKRMDAPPRVMFYRATAPW